nr:Putative uncharacterized protein [Moritella viscosa]SHO11709.1 Putative uncharacterized protein [Moritella viscosa]SHO12975.1 Putative uncharacterized protein [Moritella viscosa]SHO16273.1 Putative uncharacterized protein [Moritella viscosa]SHO18104.1 Putative uncharacterized protein [Moritella viscosa]
MAKILNKVKAADCIFHLKFLLSEETTRQNKQTCVHTCQYYHYYGGILLEYDVLTLFKILIQNT